MVLHETPVRHRALHDTLLSDLESKQREISAVTDLDTLTSLLLGKVPGRADIHAGPVLMMLEEILDGRAIGHALMGGGVSIGVGEAGLPTSFGGDLSEVALRTELDADSGGGVGEPRESALADADEGVRVSEPCLALGHANTRSGVPESVNWDGRTHGHALLGEVGCECPLWAEVCAFVVLVISIRDLLICALEHALTVEGVSQVDQ